MSNPNLPPKQHNLSIFLAASGTILEYYEYALYGFSSALLAKLFFPEQNYTSALLLTFGIYAMGSFAKPLGSLFFGWISDTRGRVKSLKISLFGIAIPTLIIGFLPDYSKWGYVSAILLLLCRILQGIFVAGEYNSVVVYVYEHISRKKSCFGNSLVGLGSILGITAASFAVTFTKSFPEIEDLWRLPFIAGGLFGLLFGYFRQHLIETPEFNLHLEITKNDPLIKKFNVKRIVALPWPRILITLLICGSAGVCYHFYFIFWPTFLGPVTHVLTEKQASFYVSLGLLTYALTMPLAGLLADRIGKYRAQLIGCFLLFIMVGVNGYYIAQHTLPLSVIIITSLCFPLFIVPCDVINSELYKVGERSSSMGIGHSLGSMIFSGTTPFMATMLWQNTHNILMPLFYISCFIIILMNLTANIAIYNLNRSPN